MNKDAIKDQFLLMVRLGIAWVLGYGGTWAAKWVIGTVVLHRSVIADALNTVAYRIDGKEDWSISITRICTAPISPTFCRRCPWH